MNVQPTDAALTRQQEQPPREADGSALPADLPADVRAKLRLELDAEARAGVRAELLAELALLRERMAHARSRSRELVVWAARARADAIAQGESTDGMDRS